MPPKTFKTQSGSVKNISNEETYYRDQTWLVAHNGWNTTQLANRNQCRSLTELLDYGVRGFALDIEGDTQQAQVLKHDILIDSVKDWLPIRDELKAWLEKPENSREIVTLFFESRLTGPNGQGRQTTPLHELDESLKAISCYRSGKTAQENAIRYYKLKELIDGTTDRPFAQRLFAFIEKEPDEGSQSLFPVMRKTIAENVYGDDSLNEKTWTDLRDGSFKSDYAPTFMNHFGRTASGNEFDRNATGLIMKHAIAFAFAFRGHYPTFVSLDYINWEPGNIGPIDAIGALQSARRLAVFPFQFFKVNDFDSVQVAFDFDKDFNITDRRIIDFDVDDDDKGITGIYPQWGDKTGPSVSAVELVSVGKRGLVNMRYKVGKGAWGPWKLPKNPKPGDSDVNHHAVYEFYEAALIGICVRRQEGYGATDFAAAALMWP
jgi:hypothetical protein